MTQNVQNILISVVYIKYLEINHNVSILSEVTRRLNVLQGRDTGYDEGLHLSRYSNSQKLRLTRRFQIELKRLMIYTTIIGKRREVEKNIKMHIFKVIYLDQHPCRVITGEMK